ncbi:MAG: adenylyl-sulfate reductase subunit alpha [Methanobacteriota archaeon]|nr:MAG: adenylyl-sulfate reductase subunit alpha [Euryarchaeota archaeon]
MKKIETDILIIGGGTAGCYAAVEAKEQNPDLKVVILEKGHIERSGCLAAGMNAINAYINPGETPETFVEYVKNDAMGLVREDLVRSIAEELNRTVKKVEGWGLPILKDESGNYQARGRWNIKINGESLKPILAKAARDAGAEVYNRVVVTNLLLDQGRIAGAAGFGLRDGEFYVAQAKSVIVATGGASGLYKPNNDGSAHHKIWYPPFNTGAGYAMGLRAGAEMTSFEMRFVALRTKDAIAPTGTLALGFGAKQVNALGEEFMVTRYSHLGGNSAPTCIRSLGPTIETKEGRGPCYMDTTHLTPEQVRELKASYLNMYPHIVLYWAANDIDPGKEPVEICCTEPYITGGHAQAGYWINRDRETTIPGLFAAGDVAGGAPYKFVSGCWAEAAIAARSAVKHAMKRERPTLNEEFLREEEKRVFAPLRRYEAGKEGVTPAEMEERLQKVMDEYAGGIKTFYETDEVKLRIALREIGKLKRQTGYLLSRDLHELGLAHEVIDRIDVAEALIHHLLYRKETRWPGFTTRTDYPERDDRRWRCFVNSRRNLKTGRIEMIERPYRETGPEEKIVEAAAR